MRNSGSSIITNISDDTQLRVNIFKNGSKNSGKVIFLSGDLETFLQACGQRLSMNDPKKLFSRDGVELTNLDGISPEEILYVSEGEEFASIGSSGVLKGILKMNYINCKDHNDWVKLNVGGRMFSTTRSTLTKDPHSMLCRMFSEDWNSSKDSCGAYLIDRFLIPFLFFNIKRPPEYFAPILQYLRTGKFIIDDELNPEGILQEVLYFNISSLVMPIQEIVDFNKRSTDVVSRKDLCSILLTSPTNTMLRCQGLNLQHVDLSKLDLSHINLKMTNLEGASLEKTNLDSALLQEANLSNANLQGASARGANLARANLQGANVRGNNNIYIVVCGLYLIGANFDDRGGTRTNLEGANLKGANLEDCNFSGANLRAANLRGCSLENANLLRADLAGKVACLCILIPMQELI